MSTEVKVATIPECDLKDKYSDHAGDEVQPKAEYDGATVFGPWAYMCGPCFKKFGVGLGTGRGQRLVLAAGDDDA